MKTKNIFKALAFAILLTTACNRIEVSVKKGYELPVTINATRQGDAPATRASYNGTSKKLEFSTGDKLFVRGYYSGGGYPRKFAGTLTWVSEGTFSGTITTETQWTGTADALLSAGSAIATLLPNGYESYGFLTITDEDTYSADVFSNYSNAFATSKATGVEQLSYEYSDSYSSGFALAPQSAILNFTINGLTASTEYAVVVSDGSDDRGGNVTTNGSGTATFAVGIGDGTESKDITLTVGGTPITLNLFSGTNTALTAGHIYNVTRSAAPAPSYDQTESINAGDVTVTAGEHWLITGTGSPERNKITIGAGATVTLDGVNIYMYDYDDSPCIECLGSATIILKDGSTNSLYSEGGKYPALWIGNEGTTLTIQGSTGILNVTSGRYCAGIGGGYMNDNQTHACGNIVIEGGVINATGGEGGAGIGSDDEGTCGTITISGGRVTAEGRGSAAGIGGGNQGDCGDITITDGAAFVEATMGPTAPVHIGPYTYPSSCTVTIDGVVNANTGSTFTHFDSEVNGATWTLTHK